MVTAICVGLLIWLVIVVTLIFTLKQYEATNVGQCFLALAIIVASCVVVQHFGSMLIGAFT